MKNLFKILLVLLAVNCLFLGCKKYHDDPRRYLFKSPFKRLSRVSCWSLHQYHINGPDSMTSLMHRYFPIDVALSESNTLGFCPTGTDSKSGIYFDGSIGKGKMELINDKNYLNIIITSLRPGYYNPFINTNTIWKIEELTGESTGNVLKISATINGINYEIIFNG